MKRKIRQWEGTKAAIPLQFSRSLLSSSFFFFLFRLDLSGFTSLTCFNKYLLMVVFDLVTCISTRKVELGFQGLEHIMPERNPAEEEGVLGLPHGVLQGR